MENLKDAATKSEREGTGNSRRYFTLACFGESVSVGPRLDLQIQVPSSVTQFFL